MPDQIPVEQFTKALEYLLEETFDNVHGAYLDGGTSLFETLATISAEEASRPVSARCASIAAQVEHTRFYLDLAARAGRGEAVGRVDWQATWRLTSVTDAEWEALKGRLREAQQAILAVARNPGTWTDERTIGGGLAVLAHTAYHLGEIRQALCTVKPDA
jgi:DinB family protein